MILGFVDEIAEKFSVEEEVRLAVREWNVTISEMSLRFEEGLRKNIPATPGKAVKNVHTVRATPSATGTYSVQDLPEE